MMWYFILLSFYEHVARLTMKRVHTEIYEQQAQVIQCI